jgi:hypothetical protein
LLLVDAHAEGSKDFKIEFAKEEAGQGDGLIEHGAPARNPMTISVTRLRSTGDRSSKSENEEFHGVGGFALDAREC